MKIAANKIKIWRYGWIVLVSLLCSCGHHAEQNSSFGWSFWPFHANKYTVKHGDTLYSIAVSHGQSYQKLAQLNHMRPPYYLRTGQVLTLSGAPKSRAIVRRKKPHYGKWLWPVRGRLMHTFIPQRGQKGIDIAGKRGQQIHASASGVVVYSGSGFSGYDHLIIIKHAKQYLTTYSHNSVNLVKEGQVVAAGQVIASLGVVDRKYYAMHFEIRLAGKPVNPLDYMD